MADTQNTNAQTTENAQEPASASVEVKDIPAGDNAAQNASQPASDEKKFSQKELDDIVKQRLERAAKGQPSKEELAAFRAWQDSQKSAEEKHADELKAAQDKQTAAEQRAADLEARLAALSKGVNAGSVEDVIALARGRMTDDVPLDKAIDEVLKKSPHFAETEAPKGFQRIGSDSADKKPAAADDKLRRAFGL